MTSGANTLRPLILRKNLLLHCLSVSERSQWLSIVDSFCRDVAGEAYESPVVQTICADILESVSHLAGVTAECDARLHTDLSEERDTAAYFDRLRELIAAIVSTSTERDPAIDVVIQHIEEHYGEPLTVEKLSALVGLTRSSLSIAFKRQTGSTVHEYITETRIRHARELLSNGEKIDAIALLVGYRSKKNFYQEFAKVTGLTPGESRRSAGGGIAQFRRLRAMSRRLDRRRLAACWDEWRLVMSRKFTALVGLVGMIVGAESVAAHHSFAAEFDANKPLKLTGVVTRVEWKNPHTYFYIDVNAASGKVVNWGMEMGSPNGLMRQGWTRHTLKIGDVVLVEGSAAKDGANIGNARVVVLAATGQRLFAASSQGETAGRE